MAMRGRLSALFLAAPFLVSFLASSLATPLFAACDRENYALAIDIGHTPQQPGAISARGVGEYAFNARLAGELMEALYGRDYRSAFIVNAEGAEIGLLDRTAAATRQSARFFLSIHHDSVQPRYLEPWTHAGVARRHTTHARGHSIFVSSLNPAVADSLSAARRLGQALRDRNFVPTLHHAEPIKGENRALLDAKLGVYDFPKLAVLRSASSPALLFEAGVITHRDEEALLETPEHRAKLIAALLEMVEDLCARDVGRDAAAQK